MSFVRTAALAVFAAASALSGLVAHAQVYRIVGPDGKVTFSDRPPVTGQAQPGQSTTSVNTASGSVSLPTELRQAVNQFPVTLYTTTECGPCGAARSFLRQRGVPYSEKTVTTREDVAALQRLAGGIANLPFVTIGGQHIPGFADSEWSQYLDAAGYPRSSQLPSGYRNPEPAPMVAVQRPAAPQQRPNGQQPQSTAVTPPPSGGSGTANPAGIQF